MSNNCRLCKSNEFVELIYDFGHIPSANDYWDGNGVPERGSLAVHYCNACKYLFAVGSIPHRSLFSSSYPYLSSVSSYWAGHAEKLALEIQGMRLGKQQPKLLEIASNDGYLLKHFDADSFLAVGIDPASDACAIASNFCGNIVNDVFERSSAERLIERFGTFDVVVGLNVLAHVPDPVELVEAVGTVLNERGLFIIEAHDVANILFSRQWDSIYHEHFSYFSFHSLEVLLSKCGFKVLGISRVDTHGGSLRVYATKNIESVRSLDREVSETLMPPESLRRHEQKLNMHKSAPYSVLASIIADDINELRTFIAASMSAGKVIAGYGAAAKASTIISVLNLKSNELSFIFDRAPSKVGKFMPGSDIPIIQPSSASVADSTYDILIIFVWNLVDEVLSDLKSMRMPGHVKVYSLRPKLRLVD